MRRSLILRTLVSTALVCSMVVAAPVSAGAGGAGWKWLNPKPSGDSLNAVSISPTAGSSCMWAVGNYGFIAKTFDYGTSWHKFTPAGLNNLDLIDIDLVADSVGWAVGANGTILKISDGWNVTIQPAPAGTGHLYAVDAISATTAIAVGEAGAIIRTTNGSTWSPEPLAGVVGLDDDLKAVWAQSATQYWVGGTGHVTSDGGSNIYYWSNGFYYNKQTGDTTFAVEDISIDLASNTLWAVGRDRDTWSPKHYRVTDANIGLQNNTGLFYAPAAPTPTASGYFTGISRPDATHTWVSTIDGEVLFFDGSNPWVEIAHPQAGISIGDLDFDVVSGSTYRGVIVGMGGAVSTTQDSGTNWATRPVVTKERIEGVDFVSSTTGYATSGTNVIKTVNYGSNWTPLNTGQSSYLLDVDFLSNGKGWAIGRSGTTLHYNGTTWSNVGNTLAGDLYGVSYLDEGHVWACGDGTIAMSNGTSWIASSDPDLAGVTWRGVDFFDDLRGIAVGNNGKVVYTADGGMTWTPGVSGEGPGETIYAVDMVSPTTAFMVGDDEGGPSPSMLMRKTINGGAAWTAMTPPATASWVSLLGVSFADANNGWIVGGNGTILRTTDGGNTWTDEQMCSEWLYSVSAVSATAAWAGGEYGALLTNYTPPPLAKVYRFYNFKNGTHFYTDNYDEKANIIKNLSHIFKYEGVGYQYDAQKASQPLYRFYNKVSQSHFYTPWPDEKDNVIAKLSHIYDYEGPAYNVSTTQVAAGSTVWRFYNMKNGSHFFTVNPEERDSVKASLSHVYEYEGPAYYLPQ